MLKKRERIARISSKNTLKAGVREMSLFVSFVKSYAWVIMPRHLNILKFFFCNLVCYQKYRVRASNRFFCQELFNIEQGVCSNFQLDCHKLVVHIRPLSLEKLWGYIEKSTPNIAKRRKLLEKLAKDPIEGNSWRVDHIVPIYKGRGEGKLEDLRTLCVACHHDVTDE